MNQTEKKPDTTQVELLDTESIVEMLFEPVDENYMWFAEANEKEAQNLVDAAQEATRLAVDVQICRYKRAISDVLGQDMADRTGRLATQSRPDGCGYRSFVFQYPKSRTVPRQSFLVKEGTTYQWDYRRVNERTDFFSTQALLAMDVMRQANIVPDAYWVAEQFKKNRPIDQLFKNVSEWRRVRRVFFLQFGHYFVAISDW